MSKVTYSPIQEFIYFLHFFLLLSLLAIFLSVLSLSYICWLVNFFVRCFNFVCLFNIDTATFVVIGLSEYITEANNFRNSAISFSVNRRSCPPLECEDGGTTPDDDDESWLPSSSSSSLLFSSSSSFVGFSSLSLLPFSSQAKF